MRMVDVDWEGWEPTIRATLLFVWRNDQLLLIRKNGPASLHFLNSRVSSLHGSLRQRLTARWKWQEQGMVFSVRTHNGSL